MEYTLTVQSVFTIKQIRSHTFHVYRINIRPIQNFIQKSIALRILHHLKKSTSIISKVQKTSGGASVISKHISVHNIHSSFHFP